MRLRAIHMLALAGLMSAPPRASALDWPIDLGDQFHPIYSTYGQFYEFAGGLHLHEGLDILAAPGTQVVARQQGKVLALLNSGSSGDFLIIATPASGPAGWNLVHLHPTGWHVGDTIQIGDILGAVADQAGLPDHLHVDFGSGADTAYFGAATVIRKPVGDPLDSFSPNFAANNPAPVVSDFFNYRIAAHDRNGTLTRPAGSVGPSEAPLYDNLYFQSEITPGLRWLGNRAPTENVDAFIHGPGSASIDVIAMAYDQATVNGTRNAPKQMQLRIAGHHFGADTGTNTIFNFTGSYLDNQGYAPMRDTNAAYIRTIYENDQMSDSVDVSDFDVANRGAYWFIMTNTDGDQIVQTSDRARSWHTNAVAGSLWHDPNAPEAAHNYQAAFRDDFYDITVASLDEQGKSGSAMQTVILDNYLQTLHLTRAAFGADEAIAIAGGEEYAADDMIHLYLLLGAPIEGQSLTALFGQAITDALGELQSTALSMLGLGDYFLVADYDGDGKYFSPLDAMASFRVIPEPNILLLLSAGIGLLRFPSPLGRGKGRG